MADQEPVPLVSFEDYPLTRHEYIGALVHFYRGERSRADAWRSRLDPTTNWAVVTTGGMLSFAFSVAQPLAGHPPPRQPADRDLPWLRGPPLPLLRRLAGARSMLEENFFIPIIRRNLVSPRNDWREFVADDLDQPKFKITFLQAVAIRLRANYIWIFLVVFVAWLAKLNLHPVPASGLRVMYDRMAVGPLGSPAVLALVVLFYATAVWLTLWAGRLRGGGDEVHGLEKAIDHWKS